MELRERFHGTSDEGLALMLSEEALQLAKSA